MYIYMCTHAVPCRLQLKLNCQMTGSSPQRKMMLVMMGAMPRLQRMGKLFHNNVFYIHLLWNLPYINPFDQIPYVVPFVFISRFTLKTKSGTGGGAKVRWWNVDKDVEDNGSDFEVGCLYYWGWPSPGQEVLGLAIAELWKVTPTIVDWEKHIETMWVDVNLGHTPRCIEALEGKLTTAQATYDKFVETRSLIADGERTEENLISNISIPSLFNHLSIYRATSQSN